MADSSEQPWSDDPNAPQIPHFLYFAEKSNFAGTLIGAMFYGIVIVLFSQCMSALLYPANRRKGGIQWGLVAHTTTIFAFVTIGTALSLDVQSVSYIDDRNFPGFDGGIAPGPLGYQLQVSSEAINIVPNLMFILNQWLADGLLLYRCYIIYSMNYWVIAFPVLMYIASLGTGIMLIDQTAQPYSTFWISLAVNFGLPYFSISLAINVILTFMIVIRLVFHRRNIRNAMGNQDSASGVYDAIITVLVESSALYTVSFLLFIGPWGAKNYAEDIFFPPLAEIQAIAPFLIILRVAKRRALTSEAVASGNVGSMHFKGPGDSTGGDGTLSDGQPVGSTDPDKETAGELAIGVETAIEEVPL